MPIYLDVLFDDKYNLIFLYFQGDVIWKSLIDTFKSQIKENCIYAIKNFKVQQSIIYRPVDNEIKIVFIYNTNVKDVKEVASKFPKFYFEFATTDVLLEREGRDKQCSGKMCNFFILLIKCNIWY
jgi:hypothetical protein